MNGHVQILEWFKNSNYKFKYYKNAITCASKVKNIKILKWFEHRNI